MNYQQSSDLLEKIKSGKKFLLNPHRGPDLDSVAAVAAMSTVLNKLGKEFDIVCKDSIPESYKFVKEVFNATKTVELEKIDFKKYDFWIALDFNTWDQGGISITPDIQTMYLDHHPFFGLESVASIVDTEASSTCEILYLVFEDWGIEIDPRLATILLSGISYDTNYFQQKNTTSKTHFVAAKLMDLGADNNYISYNVKRSNEIGTLKLWGEFNKKLKIEKGGKFAWTAIPYETYRKHLITVSSTAEYSNMIVRSLVGTNFGITMAEKEPGVLNMSIRSRTPGFDVSLIAKDLGGNGHKDASGASVKGLSFRDAVKKTLAAVRKHAKQKFVPEIPLD
ncbi:DHH family phosphoesterase [Candidatus Dojkabacteria bacterium]|nr:DHH family phosphoesterase [Candidatus Dojkabacteria bacterium]